MRLDLTPRRHARGSPPAQDLHGEVQIVQPAGAGFQRPVLFRRAARRSNRPASLAWALHFRGGRETLRLSWVNGPRGDAAGDSERH
jgi:hypothetical protein